VDFVGKQHAERLAAVLLGVHPNADTGWLSARAAAKELQRAGVCVSHSTLWRIAKRAAVRCVESWELDADGVWDVTGGEVIAPVATVACSPLGFRVTIIHAVSHRTAGGNSSDGVDCNVAARCGSEEKVNV
jgi:hypothetical protein